MNDRIDGRIKYLNPDSEYGFIARKDGKSDIFFSERSIADQYYQPKVGDLVSFEIWRMRDGRSRAVEIELKKRPKWEML